MVTIFPAHDLRSEPPFEFPFDADNDADFESGIREAFAAWRAKHPEKSPFDGYFIRIERP
jgi:hypothetical protein